MYRLALIPGDGIGPEQAEAVKSVLNIIQEKFNVSFRIEEVEAGDASVRKVGKALPEESLEIIERSDACLKAPVGESAADVIVFLRRKFDLYANIRPAKVYPNIPALKNDIDLVIVRENTEDVYAGLEYDLGGASIAIKLTTRKASLRIAEYAFRLAEFRNRKRSVIAVHKANLMRKTDGLFASCCKEVSSKYQTIKYREMYVDACAMNLIRSPEEFDVIVTTNLFGDILSDEAAQIVGSLGIAPSANIGDRFAIFEPVHGSAPDIAGKGIANPLSFILSARMMLEWLALKNNDNRCREASDAIESAVIRTLRKGIRTPDIGGESSTKDVTDTIVKEIETQ